MRDKSLIGQTLDRYRITEMLGKGGMAVVYKAHDEHLDRDVAIKLIRSTAFPPEQLDNVLKRFKRETKALAKLFHPNIVRVYDYGENRSAPFSMVLLEFCCANQCSVMRG